jgi:hypothetical protein
VRKPDPDLDGESPCADARCVGSIGSDGRCSECKRTRDEVKADEDSMSSWSFSTTGTDAGELPYDERRQPCPNLACLGMIGRDGYCVECGRSAK